MRRPAANNCRTTPGTYSRTAGRCADHVLRAVPVPAGEHTVELRYESSPLRIGLALIALAVAGTPTEECGQILTSEILGELMV